MSWAGSASVLGTEVHEFDPHIPDILNRVNEKESDWNISDSFMFTKLSLFFVNNNYSYMNIHNNDKYNSWDYILCFDLHYISNGNISIL